jgi:hypothetical protein
MEVMDTAIHKAETALIKASQVLQEARKDKERVEKAYEVRKRMLRENLGVVKEVMKERDGWDSSDYSDDEGMRGVLGSMNE